MKKKICIVLLFAIFLPLSLLAEEKVNVHLENIGLEDFIKFISKRTGQNISYSPSDLPRNARVTIYSPLILSNEDLLRVFFNILKANGLVAVKKGNTFIVVKKRSLRNVGSKYEPHPVGPPDTAITTVIQLKNVDVTKLKLALQRLVSDFGHVEILPGLNSVIITDTKEKITQIEKLLKDIDKDQEVEVKLIPIKGASAKIVAKELKTFFNELAKKNELAFKPVVLDEAVGNTLMIAAKKDDFAYITELINKIIAHTEAQKKQKVFYLKNAVAKDVCNIITKLLSKLEAFKQASISYDEATNAIIVLGTPEVYDQIKTLLDKLDVPRKQVYIEALIIETSVSKLSEFGIEWSVTGATGNTVGYSGVATTGNLANMENLIFSGQQSVALPGGFSLGVLGDVITYQGVKFTTLGALLNALKTEQGINILSNPRILTLDNQQAEIFVGENRPYLVSQKYDVNGNPIYSYDYRDVGVKLNILPHVSEDKIIADVSLEVKKMMDNIIVGQAVAPVTLTRTTTTKIELKDGEKILISGLIKNDKTYNKQKIPFLSSIPILGGLFKYKKITGDKTNLMVFLTTKIIHNQQDIKLLPPQNHDTN